MSLLPDHKVIGENRSFLYLVRVVICKDDWEHYATDGFAQEELVQVQRQPSHTAGSECGDQYTDDSALNANLKRCATLSL